MMIKIKRGFTIIELVMTIGIIGITTAMTGVVIANMSNAQKVSTDQYVNIKQISTINEVANEYISYISLNTSVISFSFGSTTDHSLTFLHNAYSYTLSFSDNIISISNDYDGEESFFKKSRQEEVDNVESCTFNYNQTLCLLKLTVVVAGQENYLDYVVRTAL